ncbi:MAG: UvrD-helicase domain-containing protein, partial [Verrucomicrobiales bacterium]
LEGMRLATFGSEEKSLQRHLETFVSKHHGVFLKGSDQALWGGERAIWDAGCLWLQGGELDINAAATALMASVRADDRYTKVRDVNGWDKAVGSFLGVRPNRLVRAKLNTAAERLLEAGLALAEGTAAIKFGKNDIPLTHEQCRHAFTLVHHVMRCEILAAQERTRGLWQVLHTYETAYHREVRSKGQLTFSDVQRLLAKGDLALTQEAEAGAEGRLLEIAYRLDARSDHWMLDEFQDTSRVQWRVIANLVDEVVQGGLPDRSLFYVGDVKQAIYAWREGDARLFHQIFDHYNQGREGTEGAIQPVTLNQSYRCCQTVVDAVNRVFGSHSTLRLQFGDALATRWQRVWGEHTTTVDRAGYVALLNPVKEKSARSPEPADRFALAAETLVRLRPIERGLTCGVLVRQNKVGRGFADYLRKHTDIPVEAESDVQVVADNPVTSAFLSLFTAATHPGDTL